MATSADYMKQLQDMGQMPDFKNTIAKAYDSPVLRPLANETASIESQYLPTIFNTFASMGTGAADMSPAAKLAMIGQNLGRITSKASANRDVMSFYNSQIGDIANSEMQKYQMEQQRAKDLYSMAFQREEAARADARARAAQAAQGSNLSSIQALMDKYKQSQSPLGAALGSGANAAIQTAGGGGGINVGNPKSLQELNALRQAQGLSGLDQAYWDTTYNPQVSSPWVNMWNNLTQHPFGIGT